MKIISLFFVILMAGFGGCDKVKGLEDVEIESYKDEKKVLVAWAKLIQRMDPDIILGYNIFAIRLANS